MSESKIKSQIAFQEVLQRLKKRSEASGEFLDNVMWNRAPLSYIDTHYNFVKELNAYQPQFTSHFFDRNVCIDDRFSNGGEDDLVLFGNTEIKGNLEIDSYQKVILAGDLIVHGVIDI